MQQDSRADLLGFTGTPSCRQETMVLCTALLARTHACLHDLFEQPMQSGF